MSNAGANTCLVDPMEEGDIFDDAAKDDAGQMSRGRGT